MTTVQIQEIFNLVIQTKSLLKQFDGKVTEKQSFSYDLYCNALHIRKILTSYILGKRYNKVLNYYTLILNC